MCVCVGEGRKGGGKEGKWKEKIGGGGGVTTYDDLERLLEALGRALVFLRRLPFRLEEGDLVQLFQRHGRQRGGVFFAEEM